MKRSIRSFGPLATEYGYYSLVHASAEAGQDGLIRQLVQKKVNIDQKDEYGRTPLFIAIEEGHDAAIKLLIENGANINARNREEKTPLIIAVSNGRANLVQLLLENKADVESKFNWRGKTSTALLEATGKNDIDIALLLLDHGANVSATNANGCTAFYVAARQGYVEMARLLLRKGAKIGARSKGGHSALTASIEGYADEGVLRFLLDNDADPNSMCPNGMSALMMAAKYGLSGVVRLLLSYRATVNMHSQAMNWTTPLWEAVYNNHPTISRILLEKGANVNEPNAAGLTPLLYTAEKGFEDVASVLLDFHADVTIKSRFGVPALCLAAMHGHHNIVRLLLYRGANVDSLCDSDRSTALHAAAIGNHEAVVRLLLEHGASVNGKDEQGRTPVFWAKKNDYSAIVQLLVQNTSSSGGFKWPIRRTRSGG